MNTKENHFFKKRITFGCAINKVIRTIAIAILLGLNLLNFVFTTHVEYNISEVVTITRAFPLLPCFIALLLFLMFYFIYCFADKLPQEKYLLLLFCLLYMIAGIYLITHVDSTLRDDAKSVHDVAMQFSQGNYEQLRTGGYIFRKVHQLGLVSFERIIGLFSFSEKFLFIINLGLVNAINYLTYKLSDLKFSHNKTINLFTIVLSYLFLPQFFFVLFAYGLVVGFFFLLLAIYHMEKYFMTNKKSHIVIVVFSITVAVLLKSNYLIGALALFGCFIMKLVTQKRWHYLALALAVVVLPVLSTHVLNIYYEIESGIEIQSEEPKIMYVAMGINPMNKWQRGPGWYDASNWVWYEQAGYDAELATDKAMECIRNCFTIYREDPIASLKFFRDKLASLWCEPMYQSVWSGPLESGGQKTHTPILRELYNGGPVENRICIFMKAYLILIYGVTIGYFVSGKHREYQVDYAPIYFIGGFLFHIVWEAKSQYVYTYIFILIPLCACSMVNLLNKMKRR